jgi:hypothetical protein
MRKTVLNKVTIMIATVLVLAILVFAAVRYFLEIGQAPHQDQPEHHHSGEIDKVDAMRSGQSDIRADRDSDGSMIASRNC